VPDGLVMIDAPGWNETMVNVAPFQTLSSGGLLLVSTQS
jgi:hypothetical protein